MIKNNDFTSKELARYNRQIILPGFGSEGQQKLKSAKVLVAGAGGLGAPLLQYLAAAGVGTIGIADFDRVEESNLQRQVLFGIRDTGKLKAAVASDKLKDLNPHVAFRVHDEKLTPENAEQIINQYDVIADGTDNFPTRYLLNDASVLAGRPVVYGSVLRFSGQVTVFNAVDPSNGERGPNYRDLYPSPPPPGTVPDCSEGGVLGVLPGIIGSMQANEVIKILTGIGKPLSGKLHIFDALNNQLKSLLFKKDPANPLTGKNPTIKKLIDYEAFCGIQQPSTGKSAENTKKYFAMKEKTVRELKELFDSNADIQLIDVREPHEYDITNLKGELIPVNEIADNHEKIDRDKPVVIYCRSGNRSANVIRLLEQRFGFDNLYNLKGGILAWSDEIDPGMPKY